MKVLDLFSGKEGFSAPWRKNGHTVITVDNNRDGKFKPTYLIDIRKFDPIALGYKEGYFDVILGGVPCTEYAKYYMRGCNRHLKKKDPESLVPTNELLKEFIRIRDVLKPRFWIVENVKGSIKFISEYLGKPSVKIGMRWFWTNEKNNIKDFYGSDEWKLINLAYIPKTFSVKILVKGKLKTCGRGRRGKAQQLSTIEYVVSEAVMCFLLNDKVLWNKRKNERILEVKKDRDQYNHWANKQRERYLKKKL